MSEETLRLWLPIGISFLSLCLASFALGWNIYRDIVLKARVRVRCAVVSLITPGEVVQEREHFVRIAATNHGPGKVKIEMIAGQRAPLWRRLIRRPQHFVIFNDHTNPLNPKLPHTLEVGENLTLLLPYDERCVLNSDATHIGMSDSFGRIHFARKKDLREARAQFRKNFPNAPPRKLSDG